MANEHINGYALALFSLAKEEKKLKKMKDGAVAISESLKDNEDYLHLLSSKRLDMTTKEKMVAKAFKGMDQHLINFILITAKTGKATIVVPVLNKLTKYINEDLNIKEGIVYSSQKLTSVEISKLKLLFQNNLGLNLSL